MKQTAILFPLFITVFIVAFLFSGMVVWGYSRQVIMFPVLVGISTCLFCVLLLVFKRTGPANMSVFEGNGTVQLRKDFHSFLGLLTILPILGILGPTWGTFIYLVAFLKLRGENWYIAVALGTGSVLIINGIFLRLLKLSLPAGLLGF